MNPRIVLLYIILIPFIGSFIGFIIGRKEEKWRDVFNIVMTGFNFLLITSLYKNVMNGKIEIFIPNIMGTGLQFKLDMFRYIFVWLTALIWLLVTIYSTQYLISYKNRNRYYLFFMLTYWSTLGIFISQNFLNLFTFFEIMSLTSYPLIIHDEDKYSHEAGETYIIMAVTGGLVLLMGLFLLYNYTQTLDIYELRYLLKDMGNIKYVITGLIIFGFGIKAGMIPLHIWLPKAHPAAPAPASAILSGVLLKTGIFGILITAEIIVPGDIYVSLVLLILGFLTMFIGGFLAMFQRNIKRILAYSSMSQMGYIIVGIALVGMLQEHKGIALYATLYHIINHMIFKVLLFMGAGIIYMALHELSINGIGGFGRNKKILKIAFLIGLCGIIGMPGFNGFISKNMLHHALSEAVHLYGGFWLHFGEVIFTISSAFTTAYLLKLFIAVFIEKSNQEIDNIKMKITGRALASMSVLAFITVFIGIYPQFIMKILDKAVETFNIYHKVDVHFYTIENIKSSFTSIGLGVLIYVFFIRKVLRKGAGQNWWYENIALNWFSLEKNVYIPVFKMLFKVSSFILRICDEGLLKLIGLIGNMMSKLGKMPLEYNVNSSEMFIEKVNPINYINKSKVTATTNLNKEMGKASYKMNSITYSIYIFGVVLLLCLIILIY
ncbi:formate hydrogenlyase subunit 3/multisubunit Na+/H+ antiporter MnhD subunit [Clostridium pascui]|uniref:complex I subunit 5 family protein n=1 Tax=Clostridium pascui TaxID=46609 RepID=UPI0019589227|nr:proton-conducting transporter membrane subunit [Clostridium pascui]MBM7869075.1 formate hydrogenlyase subunit 3/multisubunit Na+/H+ antiporter MnhD subunit [Clostridium pascui]